MTTDVLITLIKARNLIAKPENWCVRLFVSETDEGVISFCARGAIYAAMGFGIETYDKHSVSDWDACRELAKAIPDSFKGLTNQWPEIVAHYNNSHTHDEVLAMFDETISRLKREITIKELESIKTDSIKELEAV